jgi:hypothetical protein
MKYATVLLENDSKEATQLFIDYYTGKFRPKKDAVVVIQQPIQQQGGFERATTAVQNLASMLPLPYMNARESQPPGQRDSAVTTQVIETNTDEPPAKYDIPKPRTAFSAFVDHPKEMITFLEACIANENLREEDKVDLYTTLFEMYVQTASTKKDDDRRAWEEKAKALIESKKVCDALVCCSKQANMSKDSHGHFQCSPTVTSIGLQIRNNSGSRKARSSL